MEDIEEILDECLEQIATGTYSVRDCLVQHPAEAAQLEPLLIVAADLDLGREIVPSPAFKARTRAALVHHMQANPRRQPAQAGTFNFASPFWRIAFSLTILVMALLVTGTAYAQSSVPGDTFYAWKLTSERAWRAVSPDPVGTDLILANRRMGEYIMVSGDPVRRERALQGYGEVLARLASETDNKSRARIVPILVGHEHSLKDSGVTIPALDDFLVTQNGNLDSAPPQPANNQQAPAQPNTPPDHPTPKPHPTPNK